MFVCTNEFLDYLKSFRTEGAIRGDGSIDDLVTTVADEEIRLFQLSDIHLAPYEVFSDTVPTTDFIDSNFVEAALHLHEKWKRDFENGDAFSGLLVSGDLIYAPAMSGNDEEKNRTRSHACAIHSLSKLAERMRIKNDAILVAPGNHDIYRGGNTRAKKIGSFQTAVKPLDKTSELVGDKYRADDWARYPRLLLLGDEHGVVAIFAMDSNHVPYNHPPKPESASKTGKEEGLIMVPKFFDAQLERISQFLTTTLNGMEAVKRWKKYVENGATPENDLQHTFTASLLALLIIETIREGTPGYDFDAYLVIKAVLIHDIGEIYEQDTLYIDKSIDGDIREIEAFCHHYRDFDAPLAEALLHGFLLQFVGKTITLQDAERLSPQVWEKMAVLRQGGWREALIFEAVERYGYILYAYEQFRLKGDIMILVHVLRHQQAHLQRLAQTLPAFGEKFYPQSLDKQISDLLAQVQDQYVEAPTNQ